MNKKIIWGIVIVVIVIIAGWLLFRSSKPTYTCWPYCPNMTDQDRVAIRNQIDALESSTSKASNWKTYSDSVFGLSVNYPINWAVSSDAKGDPRYNVSIYDQNQPVGQAHIYNSFNIAGNENCASVVTNGWTNDGTYKFIKKVCFVEKRLLLTLIAPDEATKTIEDAVLESVKFTN